MPKEAPYIFCRYEFIRKKSALTEKDQIDLLNNLRGVPVAYRNRAPGKNDYDTFEMSPRHLTFEDVGALSWCVGYNIRTRREAQYNAARDEIDEHFAKANGIKYTRFVAVPALGVLAVNDQHTDTHLGGMPGISRFKSVVRSIKGTRVRIELAGTSEDILRAFRSWKVEQFLFSVRPFNPTRRRLGAKLHDLMIKNGVGQLSGVAKPTAGHKILAPEDGIVGEAMGLSERGYGQVAVKGRTQQGREAAIGKPHFSPEKEKNMSRQAKPRLIKVYIDESGASERKRIGEVVKALVEFYGRKN